MVDILQHMQADNGLDGIQAAVVAPLVDGIAVDHAVIAELLELIGQGTVARADHAAVAPDVNHFQGVETEPGRRAIAPHRAIVPHRAERLSTIPDNGEPMLIRDGLKRGYVAGSAAPHDREDGLGAWGNLLLDPRGVDIHVRANVTEHRGCPRLDDSAR